MSDLADRVMRVRLLLDTLDDPYPTPRGALRADAGPSPSRYLPCVTCNRQGWLKRRRELVLCLVCDGTGWKRRAHDEAAWDAYMGMPLVDAASMPRALPSVSLAHLEEEAAERDGNLTRLAFAWERRIWTYNRHGSYQELRRQLDWLAGVAPRRARLVRTVLVQHEERRLTPVLTLELELGVVMLARRIRNPRVPPWLLERVSADQRQETLAALAAQGLGAGEIARRLGVPKKVIRRRLKAIPVVGSAVAGVPQGAT